MSLTEFFANVRRYDQNAQVIFDRAEPIGQPTDLVLPPGRWRRWRERRKAIRQSKSAANDS
jgi:hypothetical protein